MIVENRIVRNFRCVLLATFGIMSVMLFIWCFDSTLAPYTMNSFFSRFSKLSEVLSNTTIKEAAPTTSQPAPKVEINMPPAATQPTPTPAATAQPQTTTSPRPAN